MCEYLHVVRSVSIRRIWRSSGGSRSVKCAAATGIPLICSGVSGHKQEPLGAGNMLSDLTPVLLNHIQPRQYAEI
ncbi:hypothetical protein CesoFtcFv8_004229 [Champsocephalus esox]|uniref:Uncharacterized protein n=1 Tax=Champsocephalus esox TaxID=159716 RepID=A0AAN8CWG7_9TELE|nr:hypothetical protein CesoFtcFv8_004229 [Champsocephalus esox]